MISNSSTSVSSAIGAGHTVGTRKKNESDPSGFRKDKAGDAWNTSMPCFRFSFIAPHKYPPLAALQREASFLRYGGVPVSSPVDTQSHPSPSRKSLSPISPHTAGPAMSVSLRTASSSTSILPKARPSSSRRWPRPAGRRCPYRGLLNSEERLRKEADRRSA